MRNLGARMSAAHQRIVARRHAGESGCRGADAGRAAAGARAEAWAVIGAAIGVALTWFAGAAHPAICVLGLGALAAMAAYAGGDRRPRASLVARLLLAAVYVTVGLGYPTPLGLAVAALGVSLGVTAWLADKQLERAAQLHALLRLHVHGAEGGPSVLLELPGGASARYAARRAAVALAVETDRTGSCWLERDGAPLIPTRTLLAAGVRADDDLRLVAPCGAASCERR